MWNNWAAVWYHGIQKYDFCRKETWLSFFVLFILELKLFPFKGNDKVTWMNLSHNKFSEKSGENLGLGISKFIIT